MKLKYGNRVVRISLIVVLGGFLFGYDTAVISGTVSSLNTFFITPLNLDTRMGSTLLGFIVSCALLGCIIGGFLSGYLSQRFGRKRSLIFSSVLFIISAVGSAWPEIGFAAFGKGGAEFIIPFIIYRIIGGIGIGIVSVLSPMYIAEMAPPRIRGRLVSWNQLAIVIGILIVYFVNYFIANSGNIDWLNELGWRWMFASELPPALVFFIFLWFIPESPRWLVLSGRNERAVNELEKIIAPQDVRKEIDAIQKSVRQHSGKLFSFGNRVIVIGILLSAIQQLVGIQVIIYYAPEIFGNMGESVSSSFEQTVLVGAVNLLFTIAAIFLVDRWGRKPLLLWGSALMAIFMIFIGFSFYFSSFGIMTLIFVLGFVAVFAFSWGPVTWVLLSEIFPNKIRSKAMAIAVAIQWITNYLVSSTFPILDKNPWLVQKFNHAVSFWIFGIIALLSFFFVLIRVPETKDKSLEEMEELWVNNKSGSPSVLN